LNTGNGSSIEAIALLRSEILEFLSEQLSQGFTFTNEMRRSWGRGQEIQDPKP